MTNADKSPAMVFALQLQGDGSAIDIERPQMEATEQLPLWIHGDYRGNDCRQWLKTLSIPEPVIDTLIRSESRPRAWSNEQGSLLILRVINLNPGQDPEDMVSLRLWVEKNRIVSIRQRRVFSVQDIRNELIAGDGPVSVQTLLTTLVERIADRISIYVDDLEEVIEDYDEKIEVLDPSVARTEISRIRRQAAIVRRYLAPQREALEKFLHQGKQLMDEEHNYQMQDLCDRIVRYVEDLDLVREQTQVLLEELINRVSQEQNSRMYVLSIIAAIFLPISFVTGMFGMNVGGLPGVESTLGFIYVSVVMATISAGIIIYFRYKKWL